MYVAIHKESVKSENFSFVLCCLLGFKVISSVSKRRVQKYVITANIFQHLIFQKNLIPLRSYDRSSHSPGGILPYISYISMYRPKEYAFWAVLVWKRI